MSDSVSIVIPTFNSEKTLELCLKSVCRQSYKNTEIIVVDKFSQDNTLEIAKKYTDLIFKCRGERSSQRNFGFKKAKGEYFLYLDSDMVLSREAIAEAVALLNKNNKLVGIYIPEVIEGMSLLTQILNFERSFYNESVIDAVRMVKRDSYQEIHGFDENLIAGEDWDFDRRVRKSGKTEIIKSPLYHLQYGLTLKKYIAKKIYYSKFIARYINKWGENDVEIKKQTGFKYRFFQVFVENEKWRKLISNPLFAILMYFLKIILGFVFVTNKLFIKNE